MGSAYFDAHSIWQQSEKPLFTSLRENRDCDVVVIGAGIAGLTCAYLLLKSGLKVLVLERERLGLGETGLTSAHLSNALDDGYAWLERIHGAQGARLAAESHTQAINQIETIQKLENIACDFQRVKGYLFLAPDQKLDRLTQELHAAERAGLEGLRILSNAPLQLFETGPCLEFAEQAQFHPLRYLSGLAQAVQRWNGEIFTHSEVVEVKPNSVKTSQGIQVDCGAIVVATGTPINNWLAVHTKNPAYRSYLIAVSLDRDVDPHALFWDTGKPYHYVRFVKEPLSGQTLALIGGEDHRTGQDFDPEDHFRNLETWARARLGLTGRVAIRWSGQIMEPVDGLAYIGRNPGDAGNVFIATGDSGHGLTHGTIAGMLLSDLIQGRTNPWESLYDPSRLHFKSLGTYLKEAAQSTVPYGDWLSDGDVDSVRDVPPGEGAVLRDGLRKIAVHKDQLGRLHCLSAVCTHLGGIVRWNSAEKTWDCPCHGSRFDRFGEVINGPANSALGPAPDPRQPEGEPESLGT